MGNAIMVDADEAMAWLDELVALEIDPTLDGIAQHLTDGGWSWEISYAPNGDGNGHFARVHPLDFLSPADDGGLSPMEAEGETAAEALATAFLLWVRDIPEYPPPGERDGEE